MNNQTSVLKIIRRAVAKNSGVKILSQYLICGNNKKNQLQNNQLKMLLVFEQPSLLF